jgi:superfamily I DNA and/or RNA helicase
MLREQIDLVSAEFNRVSQEFQELRDQKRLMVLRDAPLVGMTSTQAASLSNLLCALSPSVLVIEEAAELLEAQLLSCLVPSIQHLILIGDHQQLRPKVNDYESELKYDYTFQCMNAYYA